tara:strand:+ start:1067 stop:1300 length:234 start_codon:yes stop_codon:yes gene_type:complete
MKYTARDFVRLIEMQRFDKVGRHGMELIAARFRELEKQEQKLPLDHVSKRNLPPWVRPTITMLGMLGIVFWVIYHVC